MTRYRTADGLPGVAVAEWRTASLPGVTMNSRDLRMAAALRARSRDARLDVRTTHEGVAVAATGVVGLVRFSSFEVRVEPKLAGDHVQLLRMIEFAAGLDGLHALAGTARVRAASENLLDLVVQTLASETERLLTLGLRADYVPREAALPALRGRFLPDRQELERFGLYDRLVCRYDEHEHDIDDNRLLAVALAEGSRMATLPRVRRHARSLAALLSDVCDVSAFDRRLRRTDVSYNRHNEHYRAAHELGWLVLEARGFDHALTSGRASVRSFVVDMSELFEQFLERAFSIAGTTVEAQQQRSVVRYASTGRAYGAIRPDLLVDGLPVDAKYKRYDGVKVEASDLAQALMYAYAHRQLRDAQVPRAVLVHPSELPGLRPPLRLRVRPILASDGADAELEVLGVHIPTVLDEAAAGGGPTLALLRAL